MASCFNVVIVLLLSVQAGASVGRTGDTPLTEKSQALKKVAQLLQELKDQLVDDAKADAKQFGEFTNMTQGSIATASAAAAQSASRAAELTAVLDTAKAFQAEKKGQLATAADSLLEAQQELQLAKQQRGSEKETFVKNSQKLQESTDNLNLALTTVKSLFTGSLVQTESERPSPPREVGLLQATKKIRQALNAGADQLLTSSQQRFLTRLLDSARTRSQGRSRAVGFLQVSSDNKAEGEAAGASDFADLDEPDGAGDLTATLKEVKAQTEKELTATQLAEQKSAKAFAALTKSLEEEVTARQAALNELKSAISSSEEAAGKAKSDLLSTKRRLAVTNQQLVQLQVDLKDKTKDFSLRKKSRSEEAFVVKEAYNILTNTSAPAAVSFLQLQSQSWSSSQDRISSASRRHVARLVGQATSPGLAALLMESQSTGRKDVFKKVKAMIHDMLSKLQEQQAQDARKDSWCKSEMGNTDMSKASKETRADKLKTKMLAINAELASLKFDIATGKEDISAMKDALSAAEVQRRKEGAKAKSDLIMYEEDQRVLKEALVVLGRVYGEATVKADQTGYKAKAKGSGVVGLLQVSMDNFAQLAEETSQAEKQASSDFQEMKSTSEVRLATFEKDVEYKSQTLTKMESELVRANSDLDSYQKEVKALSKYLEELEVSCSVKGLSFEERQLKREQQLASLKEALRSLNQEG
eukprot:CAMPEP_0181478916 /NCGR_PEP_ID=MMETSP1110-20121109/43004_1 /TAXON_ID=174948 /ORGANISM="Symbiodinium sp., Strain CCMP421" /LENGTH=699 /DNA_ID=CAMNT_0023604315 /DNA_START=40 /DNA_END=2139 /DNA_ORIENTATION=-